MVPSAGVVVERVAGRALFARGASGARSECRVALLGSEWIGDPALASGVRRVRGSGLGGTRRWAATRPESKARNSSLNAVSCSAELHSVSALSMSWRPPELPMTVA